MAKYLVKPCVDIDLRTIQISRKAAGGPDELGEYQTYAVFMGEYLDEDGNSLGSFHEKVDIGAPGLDKWDMDTSELDVEAVAALTKAKFAEVYSDGTVE